MFNDINTKTNEILRFAFLGKVLQETKDIALPAIEKLVLDRCAESDNPVECARELVSQLYPHRYLDINIKNAYDVARVGVAHELRKEAIAELKNAVRSLAKHSATDYAWNHSQTYAEKLTKVEVVSTLQNKLIAVLKAQILICCLSDIEADVDTYTTPAMLEDEWCENRIKVVEFHGENFISLFGKVAPEYREYMELFFKKGEAYKKGNWVPDFMELFYLEDLKNFKNLKEGRITPLINALFEGYASL